MSEIPALDDDAVLWSVPPDERTAALRDRPLLVLLHGYGSHEGDLFGLVPYLPPEFVVAAVRAPLTPPFPAPGWSWFPIEGVQASGQDAGVEVGLAAGAGVPVLGIRGPLEGPGLMLHGAVSGWVDSVEEALDLVTALLAYADCSWNGFDAEPNPVLRRVGAKLQGRLG